jgi:hypothetical protein
MKYESSELLSLYKELLKGGKYTVITTDPQYGDLQRGFTFEPVSKPYHWAKVTAWFKQDTRNESKQSTIVPAKVLFDYLRLAITSACYVEIYETGEELTYVYGKQEKY